MYKRQPLWSGYKLGELNMTRICVATQKRILSLASDSLLINTIDNSKTFTGLKAVYRQGIIIGIAGALEFNTNLGLIKFKDVINEALNETQNIKEIYNIFLTRLRFLYEYSNFLTQILFLWTDGQNFYSFPILLSKHGIYKPKDSLFENHSKLIFNNHWFEVGEGVSMYHESELNENPITFVQNNVRTAIDNPELKTVGGEIYSITMDLEGHIKTYVNGEEKPFKIM